MLLSGIDFAPLSFTCSTLGHSVAVSLGKPSSEYAGYMITLKDIDASEIPQKPSSNEAPLEEEKAWVGISKQLLMICSHFIVQVFFLVCEVSCLRMTSNLFNKFWTWCAILIVF